MEARQDCESSKQHSSTEQADLSRIVRRTREAQSAWAHKTIRERLVPVKRLRSEIASRVGEDFAQTITRVSPSTLAEAVASQVIPLADACKFLEDHAEKILRPRSPRSGRPMYLRGVEATTHRDPFGVVLIIGPSNYPLFLPGVQIIQAIVAGNAVLMKPAASASEPVLQLRSSLIRCGMPHDLLQVLPEDPMSAEQAIQAGVDKVFLTGSAATGKKVLAQLAEQVTPACLELSGNDPVIVLPDANLDLVVRAIRFGLTWNGSETCIAPRRVFVTRENLTQLETQIALSLQSTTHVSRSDSAVRAIRLIEDAVERGGKIISGGALSDHSGIKPTVVSNANAGWPLLQADLMAPVASLVAVDNVEEAILLANSCPFALGATIFGDIKRAEQIASRLRAGSIVVNDMIVPTADPRLCFGGRGVSGFGVTRGEEGLLEMTQAKVISTRRSGSYRHLNDLSPNDATVLLQLLRLTHAGSWRERLAAGWSVLKQAVFGKKHDSTQESVHGSNR